MLAEAYDGYPGALQVQVGGPWTLAASVELTRGERALVDPGATARPRRLPRRRCRPGCRATCAGSCRGPRSSSSSTSRPSRRCSSGSLPTPRLRTHPGRRPPGRRRRSPAVLAAHDGPTVSTAAPRRPAAAAARDRRRCALHRPHAMLRPRGGSRWPPPSRRVSASMPGCSPTDGHREPAARPLRSSRVSSAPVWRPRGSPASSSPPPAGSPGSQRRGPGAFNGWRSTPRAGSPRRSRDAAPRPLAGQVRRHRPGLGFQLPAHEGRAGVARPRCRSPPCGSSAARSSSPRCSIARGGSLPVDRRVWGHLLVTGFLLATLPFTLFALVRDAGQPPRSPGSATRRRPSRPSSPSS